MGRLTYNVVIHGNPIANESPRFTRIGSAVRAYKSKRVTEWQEHAAYIASENWHDDPLDEPCTVNIDAVFARPKRLTGKRHGDGRLICSTGKDCDNIAKVCLDALQWGGVLKNDSRVHRLVVSKWWAADGEPARVHIQIVARYGDF